jgi:RNA recognition motif-containing protein
MSKKIYAGNLSYTTTAETLTSLFEKYGKVVSSTIIVDRDTSQSKGFGFVELEDDADANRAIAELSGKEVDGRKIRVNYAEEKKPSDRSADGRKNFRERR